MFKKIPMIILFSAITGVAFGAEEFLHVDTDQSGTISRSEASVLPKLYEKWDETDANSDGVIDLAEFSRFETMPATPAAPEQPSE